MNRNADEEGTMSLKDPNVANPKKTKRVAVVLANPAVSTTTGWPVGFWWSELTHPYFVLTEKGTRSRSSAQMAESAKRMPSVIPGMQAAIRRPI
jgi:putative intracellular protease/amidase